MEGEEKRREEIRKDGGKERRKGRRTAEDSSDRREGGKKEGKKARSPAPRTTGNPIIIIIAGESIVALDRIGSVWPGPRIGTRYTTTDGIGAMVARWCTGPRFDGATCRFRRNPAGLVAAQHSQHK